MTWKMALDANHWENPLLNLCVADQLLVLANTVIAILVYWNID